MSNTVPGFPSKAVSGLGIAQVVLSSIIVLLGIILLALDYTGRLVLWCSGATEVWMGVICIVAGAIGIAAGKQQRRPLIIAHMVLSIIAAVLAFIIMCVGASLTIRKNYYSCYYRRNSIGYFFYIAIAVLAVTEMIIAIVSACKCCRVVCCAPGRHGQTVVTHTTVQGHPTTGVVVYQGATYGQQGVVQNNQPGVTVYSQGPTPMTYAPNSPPPYPAEATKY